MGPLCLVLTGLVRHGALFQRAVAPSSLNEGLVLSGLARHGASFRRAVAPSSIDDGLVFVGLAEHGALFWRAIVSSSIDDGLVLVGLARYGPSFRRAITSNTIDDVAGLAGSPGTREGSGSINRHSTPHAPIRKSCSASRSLSAHADGKIQLTRATSNSGVDGEMKTTFERAKTNASCGVVLEVDHH